MAEVPGAGLLLPAFPFPLEAPLGLLYSPTLSPSGFHPLISSSSFFACSSASMVWSGGRNSLRMAGMSSILAVVASFTVEKLTDNRGSREEAEKVRRMERFV